MTFIAVSITSFYDIEQDRLNLIFTGKDKGQLMGLMTRQFLKGFLAQLPNWLSHQRVDAIPQTPEQQRETNQIHHQISQQKVTAKYEKIEPKYHQLESFLIGTVNFTKGSLEGSDQKIKLEFLDLNKISKIIFVLNPELFHKLIGEMLKQVKTWDLDNPWQEKSTISISLDTKDRMMH